MSKHLKFYSTTNMGLIAAGIAVAAVGAGASAYGSAKQASASKDAAKYAALLEKKFAEDSQKKLDDVIKQKEEKALGINELLDRYGGGAVAGSQENLDLLRKTQNDFLRLGAGDFSAFEDQLKDIMASTMANTFGAGSPVGSFTQLSAQNVANMRQAGLQTGAQVGQILGGDAYNLLGIEYGLLDQGYAGYRDIEGRKVGAISGYLQQAAESAGANWQAGGSFLTSLGGAMVTGGLGAGSGQIPWLSGKMGAPTSGSIPFQGSPMQSSFNSFMGSNPS